MKDTSMISVNKPLIDSAFEKVEQEQMVENQNKKRKREILRSYKSFVVELGEKAEKLQNELNDYIVKSRGSKYSSTSGFAFYFGTSTRDAEYKFEDIFDKAEELEKAKDKYKRAQNLFFSLFGEYAGNVEVRMENEENVIELIEDTKQITA